MTPEDLYRIKKVSNPQVSPDGKKLVFIRSYNHVPNEIFTMPVTGGRVTQLTFTNSGLLEKLDLPKLVEFWFTGAEGSKVHSFILKPPGFNPKKIYPIILTIHGGPQNIGAKPTLRTKPYEFTP